MPISTDDLRRKDDFVRRHVGPTEDEQRSMLETIGSDSLGQLVDETVPEGIRLGRALDLPAGRSEDEVLRELACIVGKNRTLRSFIGLGYSDTVTPPVIRRNILENPGWYTQYTPYQAEISQGRLEALLNYQTMVADMTGLPVANASLLDEATAAAEAMAMLARTCRDAARTTFVVAEDCHPQTVAVVRTRAEPLGLAVTVEDPATADLSKAFGVLLQYPATDGLVRDHSAVCDRAREAGARVAVACDLLALALLTPPGEFGADVALGNSQRFGVPLGYGGPHAAFFATRQELVRHVPGRLIGVSRDARGRPALRMALQTREQHIRREKATSNICTAQVLLAIMAGAYAVYHGPEGLRAIAARVHALTRLLAAALEEAGCRIVHADYFDTIRVEADGRTADQVLESARRHGMNLRKLDDRQVGIALDEPTTLEEVAALVEAVSGADRPTDLDAVAARIDGEHGGPMRRTSPYLRHEVFQAHHSETEMQRYLRRLESRDLSLTTSMIPLGSCTMKLNAAAEMLPVTWPELANVHPFAPPEQAEGYAELFRQLEAQLAEITGLPAVSLQPNSGASGEYAGLLVIREHHARRGEGHRDACLIPSSAHGTNPASAAMAGMRVVVVACDDRGNIDVSDLRSKAAAHADRLAALMVTYPSTHGVFEEAIAEICSIVHEHGGQVYMDGANLNAQVGLCRPGDMGADVCHVNLHKTFCIPHGGGGPGMGPICAAAHLADFLPGHPLVPTGGARAIGPISAAPWGSASILPISWAYVRLMGPEGLRRASEVAILNANYVARRLDEHFPVLYTGARGRVAHECIVDLRPLEKRTGIAAEDVAKRLMDYGFHAPTMSFPVPGTLMIEPTESEGKGEIDRFCDAMIAIRGEIEEVATGEADPADNVLKNAPHTADVAASSQWRFPYPREKAAWPAPSTRRHKFWPPVARIDNAHGDRHLACTCPPMEAWSEEPPNA